ncbi:GAF domain-containing sensor histidine kinase [Candidatus Roizmanbacteria bacterium]|nr:GAF domain-containing sensor histidine kinase [Candidatus Roizmanbacteria bacterium]
MELAIRNRTLSVLQKLYDIINTSLGVAPTAQKLIDEIVRELKFQKGFIALIDRSRKQLKTIAATSFAEEQKLLDNYNHPFRQLNVSLTEANNHCVTVIKNNQTHLTNFLQDVLYPFVDERQAIEIQEKLHIQTSILYPISFGGVAFGVMMLGMDKHVGELSRAERETLRELIEVVSIAIERVQLFEDLQMANERLKGLDKLKDEFVYIASHELRTPMTAIKNYLWLAINRHGKDLNDTLKKDLNRAYISTERLITLISDMLTVSRIEGNRLVFTQEVTNLFPLWKQVEDELKILAQNKKITFILTPTQEEFPVRVDKTRIMEVLHNLVGNALKFTPSGGTVTVTLQKKGGMVETSVSDTGPGIQAGDMPRLFQKFGRLDHSYKTVAETGGTGLGLYIAKQLVEIHGGKIWVASEEGQGSTFTFSLPLQQKGEQIKHFETSSITPETSQIPPPPPSPAVVQ